MDINTVVQLVNKYVEMSKAEVEEFIYADWEEGEEHLEWLDIANDDEIAGWVVAGSR